MAGKIFGYIACYVSFLLIRPICIRSSCHYHGYTFSGTNLGPHLAKAAIPDLASDLSPVQSSPEPRLSLRTNLSDDLSHRLEARDARLTAQDPSRRRFPLLYLSRSGCRLDFDLIHRFYVRAFCWPRFRVHIDHTFTTLQRSTSTEPGSSTSSR